VAIIAHKADSYYFQCKRWTYCICRWFHGSMQYNKVYETPCGILMLLEEALVLGAFSHCWSNSRTVKSLC